MNQSTSRWRAMLRRNSPDPLVPVVIGAALLVAIALVSALVSPFAPENISGPATLGAAFLILAAAYWVWPKPTLLVFALLLVLEGPISRWTWRDFGFVDELMVPALVVLALIRERPWQKNVIRPVRDVALVVFLAMGLISSLAAGVPGSVWLLAFLLLVKVFAFLYVVIWHDFDAIDVRQLYPTALGVGIVVGLLSVIELVAPAAFRETLDLPSFNTPRSGLPSLSSITGHPSIYAWFMAFNALFLYAGYIVFRRWWLLLGGVLFGIATLLSARRRAIAGLALGLVAGFLSSIGAPARLDRARTWAIVGLTGLLMALPFFYALLGLVALTGDEASQGENTARIALYQTSGAIARDEFPLGVGLGRFGSGVSRDPYSPVYFIYGLDKIHGMEPDDSPFVGDAFWARVLGETGVIGLAALLAFCLAIVAELWRATRRLFDDPIVVAFVLGAWMVFVQTLVETLASSMFESPPRVYLLFGAVGVALSLARAVRRTRAA